MTQIQDQASHIFPFVASQEEYGSFNSFFNTLRKLGWRQVSFDQQSQSSNLIMKLCYFSSKSMLYWPECLLLFI
ncbi:unnamed protein product [Paramecium octaurelia]|uniref:Uncharacterized protein n=1 Tax=Paramecium octaurelia TaxID=43137 RepID=A0A8S1Y3Q9_PAROT|nr:unnamed protein product [Paramecium octaurelia]